MYSSVHSVQEEASRPTPCNSYFHHSNPGPYDLDLQIRACKEKLRMSCALNLVIVCGSDWGKLKHYWASLVAQTVKNPPAMQETGVQFLGQEDLLEKGMSYLPQYSCLENSMDRAVWRIAKSQTRLSD